MRDETNTDVDNNRDSNNRDKNDGSRCRRRVVAHTVSLVLRQHRIVTPRGIVRTGLLDVWDPPSFSSVVLRLLY